ncbi:MAG: DNA polymerase III subunit delta' [Caldimicrobium sp.]
MSLRNLKEIIGQKPAITLLTRAIQKKQISHAYLFCGPKGVGKKTTARAFIYHLFCQINPEDPCGKCLSCQKLDKNIHPDVYFIAPELRDIKIENIRAIERFLRTGPLEAPFKVIFMEKAEKLNPEAGNALLKSLEEPPHYGLFLLITEKPYQILPTILSRTQIVRFRPLPIKSIKEYLIKCYQIEETLAQSLAELSQGSLEIALEILDSGLLEELIAFIKASAEKNIFQKLKVIDKLIKLDKNKLELFLNLLALWIWSSYLKRITQDFYPQALPEEIYQGNPYKALSQISQTQSALEYFLNKELTFLILSKRLFSSLPEYSNSTHQSFPQE